MPWTDIEYIALSKVNELRGIISDKNSRIKKLKSQLESQENELRFFRNAFPNAAHNWQKAAQQGVQLTAGGLPQSDGDSTSATIGN